MKYRCPICQNTLYQIDNSLKCSQNHSFDFAKSGYINLYTKSTSKDHGDNKLMIQARTSHLEKGYYEVLVKILLEVVSQLPCQCLVDVGCGEGYYTRQMKEKLLDTEVYGFDLSKDAILYASKHDKLTHYAISSIFDLPLENESCDVVTSLFTPIANDEFSRIISNNGYLIVVTPGKYHLYHLKESLYENVYLNEEFVLNDPRFKLVQTLNVENQICLNSQEDIQNLFLMTPYYYKTSLQDKEKLAKLKTLNTKIDFMIKVYQKV